MACGASKSTHKPIAETPSAFTLGSKTKLSDSSASQVETGFKSNFSEKAFKFGSTAEQGFKFGHADPENAPSFTFQGSSNTESKSTKEGFSFSIPVSADGFKFGIQEQGNQERNEKHPENDTGFQAQDASSQKNGSGVIFGQKSSTFTFADLAKSTSGEGFQFGKKTPISRDFRVLEKNYSHHRVVKLLIEPTLLLILRKMMMPIRLRKMMTFILSQ